jgi:hypothetical protein
VAGPRSPPLLAKLGPLLAEDAADTPQHEISDCRALQRRCRQDRHHPLVRHLPEDGRAKRCDRRAGGSSAPEGAEAQHGGQHGAVQAGPSGRVGVSDWDAHRDTVQRNTGIREEAAARRADGHADAVLGGHAVAGPGDEIRGVGGGGSAGG